jgi:hypothetical protein
MITIFLHLPMDDSHISYKQKFLKKTFLITLTHVCEAIFVVSFITNIKYVMFILAHAIIPWWLLHKLTYFYIC